ncbi:hypothetical protein PTI45_03150 [Paenibacillus nuruki]|uniref:Uncharacterized protein n=1 Tax=Paenibacillus nuruki TaxID=1886670 RepID=A0A1E3L3A0_9BACL|nr:hypothetical protein [Paenibacillus nuruki]ODP27440.1 hypothetical protein PTI45_03150 [Paenibacillus nuruki]
MNSKEKIDENELKCDRCGISHWDNVIFLLPEKVFYQFDVATLTQENTDGLKQDNICLSCFQVSITNAKYEMSVKDKH